MAIVAPVHVDEETRKHLLSSDLCAQDNSFPAVHRVPAEILAKIFTLCARNYWDKDVYWTKFCIPHWVNVSYVCRRWRAVALDFPTLWTFHFNLSLRWTEELLARSKYASLKIRIRCCSRRDGSWWSSLVEKLLDHAERIQELCLFLPGITLPSDISFRAPKNLQTLRIRSCALPWNSLNLSKLTTLYLFRIPGPSRLNIVELLAMLSRTYGLTSLHLEDALVSAHGFLASGASQEIGFPCLTCLFVVAPISAVVALLSRIDIPPRTEARLELQREHSSSVGEYAQIASVLTRRFGQSKDPLSFGPTIRSLSIGSPFCSVFRLHISEHSTCFPPGSVTDAPWDAGFPLVVEVSMEEAMERSDGLRIISDICCSIPATDLETLYVVSPTYEPDFWERILGHLHGLRCMILNKGSLPDNLVSLLAADELEIQNGDHDATRSSMFLPALEELVLYWITFASESDDPWYGASEKSLRDALSSRRACCPRLTLNDCSSREDD